jgi:hypothetical protein
MRALGDEIGTLPPDNHDRGEQVVDGHLSVDHHQGGSGHIGHRSD